MITAIIICGTILLGIVILLKWTSDMSRAGLPMFTYGECVWKDSSDESQDKTNPVGFTVTEEESSEKKSDKEIKNAIMSDPITMTAALLRGEVDIDELSI
jgi:hypothetical protein